MNNLSPNVLKMTADIVSAYCARNTVQTEALTGLIQQVYQALGAAGSVAEPQEAPTALVPAVPIKRSIFPDHIVCLEDGKKMKMLKRHLQTAYGMTPEAYRSKWGLPNTYPMVAPSYAERRSVLARQIGLGRKADEAPAAMKTPDAGDAGTSDGPKVQVLPERKRGRRKKVA